MLPHFPTTVGLPRTLLSVGLEGRFSDYMSTGVRKPRAEHGVGWRGGGVVVVVMGGDGCDGGDEEKGWGGNEEE